MKASTFFGSAAWFLGTAYCIENPQKWSFEKGFGMATAWSFMWMFIFLKAVLFDGDPRINRY